MPVTSAVVTGCESSVASIEPEKDFEEPCREISLACLRIVDYAHECGEQDGSASLVGLVNPTRTHRLSRDIGILDFFFLFRFRVCPLQAPSSSPQILCCIIADLNNNKKGCISIIYRIQIWIHNAIIMQSSTSDRMHHKKR